MESKLTLKQKKILTYVGFGLISVGALLVLGSRFTDMVNFAQSKYNAFQAERERRRVEREKADEEERRLAAIREAQWQAKLKRILTVWPLYDSVDYYRFTNLSGIKRFRRWATYLEDAGIDNLGDLVYFIDRNDFKRLENLNGIGPIGKAEIIGFFLAYGKKSFVYEHEGR